MPENQKHDDIYGHAGHPQDPQRRVLLDMLAAGGLATLLGKRAAAANPADGVVRIGYLPITDAAALLVAYANGYFAEQGLEAERPTLIRSWPALVEAFASHTFNVVHLLKPIPIWMRYNNNFPVKVAAWCHTNGSAVVVGGHTNIKSFADCGGGQIAVPFWYSMHNVVLQMALREAGLKPVIKNQGEAVAADEVNLQVLPPPEMPAAMAARKIDGYIVAEPFNALGEIKAGGRVLRFTGDIWKNHPCCALVMHEEDLAERRAWSQKVVNAVVKGALYASANKSETARMISRDGESFLPVPAQVVERAMTYYNNEEYTTSQAVRNAKDWGNGRIDFNPYPYPSATKFLVEQMRQTVGGSDNEFITNLEPQTVAQDLVDYELVTNALQDNDSWLADPSVDATSPWQRQEVFKL
ncbi:MAG: ABC transporter substrate-binding protein [Betaproteobacteria bacterium]|nr:ABC transporter substrate-binding protein [Betaproteobacteria bacterium]